MGILFEHLLYIYTCQLKVYWKLLLLVFTFELMFFYIFKDRGEKPNVSTYQYTLYSSKLLTWFAHISVIDQSATGCIFIDTCLK